jgi:putative Na+/H+ antiporter
MQMILFVLGIMFAVGVVNETGFFREVTAYIDKQTPNIWFFGVASAAISSVLDSFITAMSAVSLHPVLSGENAELTSYSANFAQNGAYWKMIAFATAVGGNILPIGSISGLALIRTERMRVGWYFANVGWKVLLGGVLGMALLWLIT